MRSSSTRGNRRIGLSKHDNPQRLLTIIDRTPESTATKSQRAGSTKKRRAPDREPDVLAPPISSDEEDDPADEPGRATVAAREPKKGLKLRSLSPSDDEDGESPDRADIRPTAFQSSWNSTKSSSSSRSKIQYSSSQNNRKTYGSARSSQESKPSSSQRSFSSKGPWDVPDLVKGDSLLSDPGRTYAAPIKRGTPTSPRESRQKRPKNAAKERARQSKALRESTPPPTKIRLPEDFLHSPKGGTGTRAALDIPAGGIADSPSPERQPQSLRHLPSSPSVPTATASLDTRLLGLSEDDSAASLRRQRPARKADGLPILRGPGETDKDKKTRGATLVEPRPTDTQLDLSFGVDDSSLSELSSDDFEEQKTPDARCPYCSKPISADLLRKFSGGATLNFRAQRRLCTAHKEDEARAEWAAKGYPDIDWSSLKARISSHHDYLEGVLRGARCHYGDRLERDVKAGKKRNLARADFDSSPGYYGARGFRAMQESIFARFSDLLRKRAVEDELVSARGYSLYVQAVLVPELAVRLVKEDMRVGAEAARGILEESTWVGDLLCEDVGDTVDESNDDVF